MNQLLEEARRTAAMTDLYQQENERANREAELREAEALRASLEAARADQEATRAEEVEAANERLRREVDMLKAARHGDI